MMGQFVFRNLFHRPVRTIIGVLAIAVEIMLVVVIVGLTSGHASGNRQAHRRHWRGHHGAGARRADSDRVQRLSHAHQDCGKVAELKYIQAVAPALLQFNSSGGIEVVYGIDPESFRAVSGGFIFLAGHDMEGPDDLLVDDWAAKAKHLTVGSRFRLFNHDWKVAGIVEHGKGGRLFVPITTLQELVGATRQSFYLPGEMHPTGAYPGRHGRNRAASARIIRSARSRIS